jgi:hypothetical protein
MFKRKKRLRFYFINIKHSIYIILKGLKTFKSISLSAKTPTIIQT